MTGGKFNNKLLYGLLPAHCEGIETLTELALDLRWSWYHAADELWRRLDPELWNITHNPWIMLQTASRSAVADRR
jgi:starch phosphorylase